ncbi:hypothetical protein BYT27DRAFT_7215713 [Phlegmacium glaucopus]|nr:hypothetical protein BYT27DRAFT_7215713 [Phlegmacium glaucopus]
MESSTFTGAFFGIDGGDGRFEVVTSDDKNKTKGMNKPGSTIRGWFYSFFSTVFLSGNFYDNVLLGWSITRKLNGKKSGKAHTGREDNSSADKRYRRGTKWLVRQSRGPGGFWEQAASGQFRGSVSSSTFIHGGPEENNNNNKTDSKGPTGGSVALEGRTPISVCIPMGLLMETTMLLTVVCLVPASVTESTSKESTISEEERLVISTKGSGSDAVLV